MTCNEFFLVQFVNNYYILIKYVFVLTILKVVCMKCNRTFKVENLFNMFDCGINVPAANSAINNN